MNPKYLASLNGWRAVSISFVLGYHFLVFGNIFPSHPRLIDGNFGVRLFFGISGFIITWLLLQEEKASGDLNLKNFYIRRALKIWPVYFLYIVICFFLQFFNLDVQDWDAWRGLLTFTRNFHDAVHESNSNWVSAHLWTVSVEEQFYLAWPFVFLIKRIRIPFLALCISFSIVFRTIGFLGVARDSCHYLFQLDCTLNYFDTLGWGCLGAFVLSTYQERLLLFAKEGTFNTGMFGVGFSLIFVPYILQLGQGLQAFGFVILLIHSVVNPTWLFYRFLNRGFVEHVGICSYSIYIWQQLIAWIWPRWLWWGFWIPCAVAAGFLSYRYIEQPFLRLKKSFGPGVKNVRVTAKSPEDSAVLS